MGQAVGKSRHKKREKVLESQRRAGAVPGKSQMYLYGSIAVLLSFMLVGAIISMIGG
jgi:hypothetical protein